MAEESPKPTYRIMDLDLDDRPRKRLARLGPGALTNAELIAILLRVGVEGENAVRVGQRLLNRYGGIRGLNRADYTELVREHGIKEVKVSSLKAVIEFGRRLTLEAPEECPSINSPVDAAALVQYEMQALEKEHFRVIILDTRNHVIEIHRAFEGSVNTSVERVAEVFTQSPEDIAITRRIVDAGKLMEIEVLDHLIIGQGRYVSMKERGLGFDS